MPGLPANGTGCMAWLRASDSSLSNFTFVGCLLTNNRTTGHVSPSTIAWNDTDLPAAFMECPDVFPISGSAAPSSAAADSDATMTASAGRTGSASPAALGAGIPATYVAIASLYNWHKGAYPAPRICL